MKATSLLLASAALLATSPSLASQDHRHSHAPDSASGVIDGFLARARSAGERYQDRRNAIADGYRRMGPDFPSMGEHWVHPRRMVEGDLDADSPQALSYALIDGVPRLTGVIYARPLLPGEPLPDFPAGVHAWHDHSGSIEEESVLLRHSMDGSSAGSGVRLAMLHVWMDPANPAGVFESDNWALPFARLGLRTPERFDPSAAKALALVSGGDEYYLLLFRVAALPDPHEAAAARALIQEARSQVTHLLARRSSRTNVEDDELILLGEIWSRLWNEVRDEVGSATRDRMDPALLP